MIGSSSSWKDVVKHAGGVDLSNKVAIVTGSNSGIGVETAKCLAFCGAHVIMACRTIEKAEKMRLKIIADTNNDNVEILPLDLGSFQSVREFVQLFLEKGLPLHILINNAGVMMTPQWTTEDGIEYQMGINHFGHFLLTNLLLDTIVESAPARIVNLSSLMHKSGHIDFDDLMYERGYDSSRSYSASKLMNVLFTKKLAEILEDSGVNSYAVHPGVINTNLTRDNTMASIGFTLASPFLKNKKQGAATSIYCAIHPNAEHESGLYYADCSVSKESKAAKNKENIDRLWEISLELCGLKDDGSSESSKGSKQSEPQISSSVESS
eukprot:TRINITY_DN1628_c0_g1_i2.p1 TRINITY_DN1628_c0_g1~~TRINITY_DN1628_c0_g1_i2.p1  ORF type:complete len:323 (-),score=54.82 TRINITY_DN1628_c0_g1_i2:231-1199(-)